MHIHRLEYDASIYIPTGEFADTLVTDEPWHVDIPIARITPPRFRPGMV